MQTFCVSGRTWPSHGYKQIDDFTLQFDTAAEANAAETALRQLGKNIYVAPTKVYLFEQEKNDAKHS